VLLHPFFALASHSRVHQNYPHTFLRENGEYNRNRTNKIMLLSNTHTIAQILSINTKNIIRGNKMKTQLKVIALSVLVATSVHVKESKKMENTIEIEQTK
jgi:hypothetical protein